MFFLLEHSLKLSDEILTGDALGADAFAREYAENNGFPLTIYCAGDPLRMQRLHPTATIIVAASWETQGKSAGMIRNKRLIADAESVYAFMIGISKGTKNTLQLAKIRGLPTHVFCG